MKHLLFILPYLNQAGTEKQALSLIEKFQDDYYISLLAPDGEGVKLLENLSVEYHQFERLDFNFIKGLSQFLEAIKNIHKNKPIDLIHIHAAHKLMILVKISLPKIPLIFTVHGYHGDSAKLSYQLSAWFSNLWANQVISVCQEEYNLLKKFGLKENKLNLVFNGVKKVQIDQEKSYQLTQKYNFNPEKNIIIGTAARLTPAKGLTYLLQGFQRAKISYQHQDFNFGDVRLIIAGNGELEQKLQQEAVNLKIDQQVIFTGYVDDLPNLMTLYDIFILPSLQEPFGLVCAEAMALSKPIIGTKVGGIPEQVKDEYNGFIIEPKNPQQIAEAIIKLINNPSLRNTFGNNSYQRYLDNFTQEEMIKQTLKVYFNEL